MAFVADLKWRQHRRPCFWSGKHHSKILALTSRLAGSFLYVPFWLSLISQHRRCQWKFQWFVPFFTHSVSQCHLLAILSRLLSGFAHVLSTTSISGSIVEDIHLFPIKSAYAWAVLKDFFRSLYSSLDSMNGAFAFSPPSKKWLGVSAVKS